MLKNEYPKFGGTFEVINHSELISSLIKEGKITPTKKLDVPTVYHDPCYLGRYNDIYTPPRQLLNSTVENLREFSRNKSSAFCCGGGGGNSWYEVPEKERISVIRLKEAEQTGAELLTVACPFCVSMFEDAIKARGLEEKMQVKDIAEIVENSL